MQIENSFEVAAPPEKVFGYLLDVNQVVGCVPGAELSEVVDPQTFKGRVKIKVGPVSVAYAGTARIAERDDASRTAVLEGEGRETTGPGNARARATMRVEDLGGTSRVVVSTDFTVAGRVAQFGRGLMEDVSRSLVNQMAACIKANLEAPGGAGPEPVAPTPPAESPGATVGPASEPLGTGASSPAANPADTAAAPESAFAAPAAEPATTPSESAAPPPPSDAASPTSPASAGSAPATSAAAAPGQTAQETGSGSGPSRPPVQADAQINALALFWAVLKARIRRLFGRE